MTKTILFNFLITLGCWIRVTSGQDEAEIPDVITIESLIYAGRGCQPNSVAFSISDDRTTFSLLFHGYEAIMDPGVSPLFQSRNYCHINVDLRVPQGWSYSIASVHYDRGYLDLEEGTFATFGTSYYFSDEEKRADRLETRWDGPLELDYSIREYFPPDKLVWSECGAPDNLVISSDIRVAGDRSKWAHAATNNLDGSIRHTYGLQWQQC